MNGNRIRCWALLACLLLSFAANAATPLFRVQIPDPLKPWIDWVLYGEKQRNCTFRYNSSEQRICAWPAQLTLNLFNNAGQFTQEWEVLAEGWIPIPGNARRWPEEVTLDGRNALVVDHDGQPVVKVTPGNRRVAGKFRWGQLPKSLAVPPQTGLLRLQLYDKPIDFPELETDGTLWLRTGKPTKPRRSDRLKVQVQRLVTDTVPLQILTRIQLEVAGAQREVTLHGASDDGAVPLSLRSALPARLESEGGLRIQVRPGTWVLELTTRQPGPVTNLARPAAASPWPAEEVWSFATRANLRVVKVTGVDAVDPRQTQMPDPWRTYPAYRMERDSEMKLEVVRRGNPDPEPDRLTLERSLWLDFDGSGYSIQDLVGGSKTSGWRLEMNPPVRLGRVTVDGQSQFITRIQEDNDREGVELRRGEVSLVADSRLQGPIERVPAVGWDHDFEQVETTLNLPPGWRLLHAQGVDRVSDTWLQRWTLLDLFIVLVTAIAVARLWGWHWGLLALLALGLAWHELYAPRYVWLNLLAAVALLRVLPQGRLRTVMGWYRNASILTLLVLTLYFVVHQVRTGLFPQLERPWQAMVSGAPEDTSADISATSTGAAIPEPLEAAAPSREARKAIPAMSPRPAQPQLYDPTLNVQTGAGLPVWTWTRIPMRWTGPVTRDHEIRLVLISPGINSALNGTRVLLMLGLVLVVIEPRRRRRTAGNAVAGALALAFLALPLTLPLPSYAQATQFPPQELLAKLKERLLPVPECLPTCAQIARLSLDIRPQALRGQLEIHTLEDVALPLPGSAGHWLPEKVTVNNRPAKRLMRTENGELWLGLLAAGHYEIRFAGPLPGTDRIQIPLPLRPHRVDYSSRGWSIEGVHEDGVSDEQLLLTRQRTVGDEGRASAVQPSALPPFARVERTLHLNLEWTVETRVQRLSPAGSGMALRVPLLTGESVTTPGVRMESGSVLVNLTPEQNTFSWRSVLREQTPLVLTAAETLQWTEVWKVNASPLWHLQTEGIPVVHHEGRGRWLPQWRPWPGESVTLGLIRPRGVEGPTVTIERSRMLVSPGKRNTDVSLALTVRSGRGGEHTLMLPENISLQSVAVDDLTQPIRADDRSLTLPLRPGKQRFEIRWTQPVPTALRFAVPAVDLGRESVNSEIRVRVPGDRWVLAAWGPRLGPAVLFWGTLLVVLIAAIALSRSRLTPLRVHQWFLLGIGLTQIPIEASVLVVGWLLVLGARARMSDETSNGVFNLVQIGVGILSLLALATLVHAVQQGLLGAPEMQIAGNGSAASHLDWYQDRSPAQLAQPSVVWVPVLVYRLLMLAWALWLASSVVKWLRWGWECYSTHGLWRKLNLRRRRRNEKPAAQRTPETDGDPVADQASSP